MICEDSRRYLGLKERKLFHICQRNHHKFFLFVFFVSFGQMSAYKMTDAIWFNAVKNEEGFKFAAFFYFTDSYHWEFALFLNWQL